MSKNMTDYEVYVLNLLSNGKVWPLIDIVKRADSDFGEVDNEILKSGGTKREKEVRWAVQNLFEKGYIDRVGEGLYQINVLGENTIVFLHNVI